MRAGLRRRKRRSALTAMTFPAHLRKTQKFDAVVDIRLNRRYAPKRRVPSGPRQLLCACLRSKSTRISEIRRDKKRYTHSEVRTTQESPDAPMARNGTNTGGSGLRHFA